MRTRHRIVLERAFGHADLASGNPLTPRHRFRVASHSKSYTAAGVMKLREQGKLKLDDHVGHYVKGLNPRIARTTLAQILSHSAGIVRDGKEAGQFLDRRPFLNAEELMADLRPPPAIEPNTRFKYSNHGFGLIGLAIEAVTGEPYTPGSSARSSMPPGLRRRIPTCRSPGAGRRCASGHSGRLLLGRRVVIPGDYTTNAIAPAGGVVSTASDLALFFAQLSPKARKSVLSVASRREMVRRQWRNQHSSLERYYGLGTISGSLSGWEWFGHSGGLQGYITRTCVIPEHDLTVAVLTNAIDGWAGIWVDGAMHILRAFSRHGAPSRKVRDWSGRWWSVWGAVDLVPMGNKVLVVGPGFINPIGDAGELEITARDQGRFALADGYSSYGEPVRRVRDRAGKVVEIWLGGQQDAAPKPRSPRRCMRATAPRPRVAAARRRMRKPSRRRR